MFSRAPNAVHHPAIAGRHPNLSRKVQICSEETIRPVLEGWSALGGSVGRRADHGTPLEHAVG